MSISILNRGASGGLKPELTVIAPAGSTIDLLQNGIILDTYTLGASETEHTFVVKVCTYTVRGTLGEQSKSVEVVIDVVGQYAVEVVYKLWLYRDGNECNAVTGGWTGYTYDNRGSVAKNSNHLLASTPSTAYSNAGFCTNSKVDLTKYTTLKMEYTFSGTRSANEFGVHTSKPTNNDNILGFTGNRTKPNADSGELAVDISAMNDSYYVKFVTRHTGTAYTTSWAVYKVWLE